MEDEYCFEAAVSEEQAFPELGQLPARLHAAIITPGRRAVGKDSNGPRDTPLPDDDRRDQRPARRLAADTSEQAAVTVTQADLRVAVAVPTSPAPRGGPTTKPA